MRALRTGGFRTERTGTDMRVTDRKKQFLADLIPGMLGIVIALSVSLYRVEAQTPQPAATGKSYTIEVAGTKEWVDTNIYLRGGAKLRVTASGQITYPTDDSYAGKMHTAGAFGPDGLSRGFADLLHQYPVTDAGHGALVG